jgi:hypothetical protein
MKFTVGAASSISITTFGRIFVSGNAAIYEPRRGNADFPVGASRRLENRRYEAERVQGPHAR